MGVAARKTRRREVVVVVARVEEGEDAPALPMGRLGAVVGGGGGCRIQGDGVGR